MLPYRPNLFMRNARYHGAPSSYDTNDSMKEIEQDLGNSFLVAEVNISGARRQFSEAMILASGCYGSGSCGQPQCWGVNVTNYEARDMLTLRARTLRIEEFMEKLRKGE